MLDPGKLALRGRVDGSWSVSWVFVSAVAGSGFGCEMSNCDGRVGEGGECVDPQRGSTRDFATAGSLAHCRASAAFFASQLRHRRGLEDAPVDDEVEVGEVQAEHKHPHEPVEHDTIRHPQTMTVQRILIHHNPTTVASYGGSGFVTRSVGPYQTAPQSHPDQGRSACHETSTAPSASSEVFMGMDNGREERSSNPARLRW